MYGFGSGILWGTRTDVANSTPRRFGVLQDVQFDLSGEVKELYGQYQFPVDVARGKVKIECKAKFATISGNILNDLWFGDTATATQDLIAAGEIGTVATTLDDVIVQHATAFADDLGVRYHATGIPFTKVASAPAAGQYTVNAGGTYTFAAGDSAAVVEIDYEYTSASGGVLIPIANQLMGYAPRFQAVLTQIYNGKTWTLTLNQCISSKLSLPTKIDDYVVQEFDFSAYADASNNVGTLSVGDLS